MIELNSELNGNVFVSGNITQSGPRGEKGEKGDKGDTPELLASEVIQDSEHRMVTDAEKAAWNQAGDTLNDKADLTYCTCATAASTVAKVATISAGAFSLAVGAAVDVKFENYNSANAPTLNVNDTGAKLIRLYESTSAGAYSWSNGAVVRFIYDGENWVMQNGTRGTLTYYGAVKLSNSVTSTSTVLAATSSAVKQAYDLAENAIPSSKRAVATVAAAAWAWWKNNSFTNAAIKADNYMKELKEGE